jgi:hypothetical protein
VAAIRRGFSLGGQVADGVVFALSEKGRRPGSLTFEGLVVT